MAAPFRAGQALGFLGPATPTASTFQNNAAANWFAMSFVPDSARTISACRVNVSAVAGTLGASDITCDLYDSAGTNGAPGSSIETGKLPSSTITAAGFYDFTGFATSLTAGLAYWFVFKNANGTPASNNCTFRYLTTNMAGWLIGTTVTSRQNWCVATSTNTGGTYSRTSQVFGLRAAYADSTYDGIVFTNTQNAAVGDGVYATRESGVKFTSPSNAILKVAGLAVMMGSTTGSPTGTPQFGLWTGATPANQGYTTALSASILIGTNNWFYSYFANPITLSPGTVTRVTLGETTQSDTNTKYYTLREMLGDTDSNSAILLPWNGTCTKTYFDGTNWTDSTLGSSIFAHALLLDSALEFGPTGGGGSGAFIFQNHMI